MPARLKSVPCNILGVRKAQDCYHGFRHIHEVPDICDLFKTSLINRTHYRLNAGSSGNDGVPSEGTNASAGKHLHLMVFAQSHALKNIPSQVQINDRLDNVVIFQKSRN